MKLLNTIEIPALKGKKVIADSKLFTWVDSDFKNWGANKPRGATKKMKLDVFEMDKDATFAEVMSTENLLTQEQILYFIEKHSDLLRTDGLATFFPFKSGEKSFVACVFRLGGELEASVYRFSRDLVWRADRRLRVVVPQLKLGNSEKALNPSDTLTLAIEQVKKAGYQVSKIL